MVSEQVRLYLVSVQSTSLDIFLIPSSTHILTYIDSIVPGVDGYGKVWSNICEIWWIQFCGMEILFQSSLKEEACGDISMVLKSNQKKLMFRNSSSGRLMMQIISWILGSVDTHVGISMRGFKMAAKMWNYLEKVHQQLNWQENRIRYIQLQSRS